MQKQFTARERLLYYSQARAGEVLEEMGVTGEGLSAEQAEAYRASMGENRVSGMRRDSVAHRLRRAFCNPFSLVLLILALISLLTDVLFPGAPGRHFSTPIIIAAMLIISGLIRFVQEMNARKVTRRLTSLVQTTVRTKRDGVWQEMDASALVAGDLVKLEAGDSVPADIRLLETEDFFVTESGITGESGISEKYADALPVPPKNISDYRNCVFTGATVTGGRCTGIVLAVGAETLYGGISGELNLSSAALPGEQALTWVLVKFMIILAPIVLLAYGLTKGEWADALLFALSVAASLMPELLSMVITACLSRGTAAMGRKQTIIRHMDAIQGFGGMDILCVDKTGTLTGDRLQLEYYTDILGNESGDVLDCAFLNSHYHTGVANSLDRAILEVENMPGKDAHWNELTEKHKKIDELPFDYQRKCASVLLQDQNGANCLLIKGSIEEVAARCSHVYYKGESLPMDADRAESIEAVTKEMLTDGMKVLAVAGKRTDVSTLSFADETDLTLLGYLAFLDAPRESAAKALMSLQDLHLGVKVLTGDRADVAISVCRRLGIDTQNILTGAMLAEMTGNDLPVRIENATIFAELSPAQKTLVVEALQENGHRVGYLGDGINDLPAVLRADVGISVDTAADAVKQSGDVILLKKDLNVLAEGVREGRKAFVNMTKYIKITTASNFGNICALVLAALLLPFFPMTSVQLLLLDILYDLLCLALPWDKVDADLSGYPLEWTGRSLVRFSLFFGIISTVFDVLTFACLFFYVCPAVCGGSFGSLDMTGQALFAGLFQTGWFLESLWSQVLALHLLRTAKVPFFQSNSSGSFLIATLAGLLVLTLLAVTPIGSVFGFSMLPGMFYLILLGILVLYFLTVTVFKKRYVRDGHNLF